MTGQKNRQAVGPEPSGKGMERIRGIILIIFSSLIFHTALAVAGEAGGFLDPYHVSLDNTIGFDYYEARGDESSSPYRFEGLQGYNQFNLTVTRRISPFHIWRGQLMGVLNDSDYRSPDNGFVPERINLFHERGNTSLPYRVDAGDFYAYFSMRTLQRSLKGVQLEFQPQFGRGRHSIIFLSGANQPSWKHFQAEDNLSSGISYLIEDPSTIGRLSINFVNNSRQEDPSSSLAHRSQDVYSIAAEQDISFGGQRLTIEGELSRFEGDHNTGQDREETGLFFQLSGRGRVPLSYRLRYEQYGQDYQPEGAVVPAGRRSYEAHGGWMFSGGLRLRGRVQEFRDDYETGNPLDTTTYGINLSGSLLRGVVKSLSGGIDMFVQDVGNRDRSTNYLVKVVNLNLSKPLFGGWNSRVGLYYSETNNQISDTDTIVRQLSLSGEKNIQIKRFRGSIAPGVVVRGLNTPGSGTDIYPTLALNLRKGRHSIGYNSAYNYQERDFTGGVDVGTFSHSLNYRYNLRQDTIGVELSSEHRDPSPGEDTDSYRVAVFWRHFFDKPVKRRQTQLAMADPPPVEDRMIDLTDIRSGSDLKELMQRLSEAGIKGPVQRDGLTIYEVPLLEEIEQRQRLVLVHRGGRLEKSALIIEFDDVGRPEEMIETFERIRSLLIERYGRPDSFFNRGEDSANIVEDVNNDAYIRITEWRRPGDIIRFGIPRRYDRQVRMEVQFATTFPAITNTLWSIEEVR